MAGRGTGLGDLTGGNSLTPLVDLSSYGAAERASARALGEVAQGLSEFRAGVLSPMVQDQARQDAAAAIRDGRLEQADQITEYGQVYNDTLRAGARAEAARASGRYLDELVAANPYDPAAFKASSDEYRARRLEEVPDWLAIDWAANFDTQRDQIFSKMRLAQVERDAREAAASILGRRDELVARLTRQAELGTAGDATVPTLQADMAELESVYEQIEANPLLSVDAEEADRQRLENVDQIAAATFAGSVRRAFREQGEDAALALIQSALPAVGDDGAALPQFVTPGAGARPQGLVERGNIDLASRPVVQNPDGSVSTVRSITIEQDGRHYVIPTVSDDGQVLSDEAAVAAFNDSGRHLGAFDSSEAANGYAETLSADQGAGMPGQPTFAGRARELALTRARAALAEESTLAHQRANIANARQTQAAQEARRLLEAMRYNADVDPEQLRSLAEMSGDVSLVAEANWAIEVGVQPPPGFSGGGGAGEYDGDTSAAGGFESWSEFFFEAEGGDALIENDNGRGPSRWGINQQANPDVNVRGLAGEAGKRVASRILRERYWDQIGGDRLPPSLAFVAADAAAVAGVGNAREWLDRANGNVGVFLQQQEAHYRALARRDPQKYGDDLRGWLNRLERARGVAARIESFSNNRQGFASDPLGYAMGGSNRPALARVAALPVDGFMSPDSGQRLAWFNAIRSRYATGESLATTYQVPRRVFTDGERAAYASRFQDDPRLIIPFATQLVGAVGGRKAREALVELGQGQSASTVIHIADLAATGGDRRFAEQAALGLQRRAAGETLDTDTRDDLQRELQTYRSIFAESPQFLAAVSNAAQAAALADEAAGSLRSPGYYAQAALGRTTWQGRAYGGAGGLNGAETIYPRWLNPAYADEALEALAENWFDRGRGPVYGSDEPIPARAVARMQLRLQPNGRYRLVDRDGRAAYARSGRPFELDMEAGRPFLERVLGQNAVRPD